MNLNLKQKEVIKNCINQSLKSNENPTKLVNKLLDLLMMYGFSLEEAGKKSKRIVSKVLISSHNNIQSMDYQEV